jgi:CRP-like cAMP-binding protein
MTSSETQVVNRLLAAMPPAEWSIAHEAFDTTSFSPGETLWDVDDPVPLIYFPVSGVLSAVVVMDDGSTIEALLVGAEGAAGISAAFGVERSPWRINVQAGGAALTIAPATIQGFLADMPTFQCMLFRYSHAMQQHATQIIACNRFHPIAERLARWLLLTIDRVGGDQLEITHELLAGLLGTHRPSVTLALRTLERAGVIRHAHRGQIVIQDRAGLEAASCECYQRIVNEMGRLFELGGR